jgi:hypothetical protein
VTAIGVEVEGDRTTCKHQAYCGPAADICKLELEKGKSLPQTRLEKQKRQDGEELTPISIKLIGSILEPKKVLLYTAVY